MNRGLCLLSIAALAASTPAHAATWYVSPAGDDAAAGDLPGAPLATPAAAVARAAAGDLVQLAAGTYPGAFAVDAKSGLALQGGWDLAFAARDTLAHETVLEGDGTAATVTFSGGTGYLLEGVTVRGGSVNVHVTSALGSDQPVTLAISDCTVTAAAGYGVYSQGAYLVVDRSRIVANGQDGIAAHSPYETNRADITRNLIAGNGTRYIAGALYLISSRLYRVHNNVIAGNSGWGVWIAYPGWTAEVLNNTIVGNGSGGVGTGYYKTMWIANNVIAFNGAPGVNSVQNNWIGGGNNDVYGNVGGDWFQASPSPTDLSVDPLLDADHRLTAASPLVDAGADLSAYLADDRDGQPRTRGAGGDGLFDIGADENLAASRPVTTATVTGTAGTAPWYVASPVQVALAAWAPLGIAEIRYAVDGGAEVPVPGAAAAVPVTGDGVHTVTFHAVSATGRAEAPQSVEVALDTTRPSLTLALSPTSLRPNGRLQAVVIGGTAADPTSGVASVEIVVTDRSGAVVATASALGSTVMLPGTRGQVYRVRATATNGAGLVRTATATLPVR